MSFDRISQRLQSGRPLVLDADSGASFRARGVELDLPGTLGLLLRENPDDVLSHHLSEVASRVDVLSALTADTTPRALAEVGMQHRSAQLTGRALELASEAAQEAFKPVAVAGVIGSDMVAPMAMERLFEELSEHADRLRAAGSELVIARGPGSRRELTAAVTAAARTNLPIWVVLEYSQGSELTTDELTELFHSLRAAGASVLLFEVPSVTIGLRELERARSIGLRELERARTAIEAAHLLPGVLLAASHAALRGFVDPTSEPEQWAEHALDLSNAGARVLGGGAGTTEAHTRALALALGSLHPSVAAPRPD